MTNVCLQARIQSTCVWMCTSCWRGWRPSDPKHFLASRQTILTNSYPFHNLVSNAFSLARRCVSRLQSLFRLGCHTKFKAGQVKTESRVWACLHPSLSYSELDLFGLSADRQGHFYYHFILFQDLLPDTKQEHNTIAGIENTRIHFAK